MLSKGFGGGERYFVDLAIALAESGHQVQAVVHEKFNAAHLLTACPDVQIDTVNSLGMWDRLSLRRLVKCIEGFAPDVMHSHMARAAWAGSKATKSAHAPLVATTHNYVDLKYYRGVARFIPTTADQEKYLVAQGVDPAVVRRIPNFSMLQAVQQAVAVPAVPIRFASFGRFVHKKGYAVLLEAFARARDLGLPQATLSIGGDGPLAAALRRQCQELGLERVVKFDGWIEDVDAYLKEADVFVLPSLDEPFGIVMLEAMASGRPIVSTRTQGPSEVLDESCAYFAEIGDAKTLATAMLELARDFESASHKADVALRRYRQLYHRDAVVPQIEALYLTVAGRD